MIIRVFDGGEGWIKGGTAERSRECGVSVPFETGLDDGEVGGEVFCWAVIFVEYILLKSIGGSAQRCLRVLDLSDGGGRWDVI